jgi:hypothetical protein
VRKDRAFRVASILLMLHVVVGVYAAPYRAIVAWPPAAALVFGFDLVWPFGSDEKQDWLYYAAGRAVRIERMSYVVLAAEALIGYWLARRAWGGSAGTRVVESDDRWMP